MKFRAVLLFLTAGCLYAQESPAPPPVDARDRALWEVGLIGAGFYSPDYPAAGQKHAKWLAAPYGIYRGRILKADREGARARLVHWRPLDMEMSFAAAFASHSKDNVARQGMPDLDYLLEAGPRASVLLSRLGGTGTLRFFLPVRAVFSTDFGNFKHRGFTVSPALFAQVQPFLGSKWIALTQLAGRFGNRQMSAYFYDIAPEFARPDRPFYDARAGYMGTDLFAGIAVPMGARWRLFTGGQLYLNAGSANSTSPLYLRRIDYSVGLGISYALFFSRHSGDTQL